MYHHLHKYVLILSASIWTKLKDPEFAVTGVLKTVFHRMLHLEPNKLATIAGNLLESINCGFKFGELSYLKFCPMGLYMQADK